MQEEHIHSTPSRSMPITGQWSSCKKPLVMHSTQATRVALLVAECTTPEITSKAASNLHLMHFQRNVNN